MVAAETHVEVCQRLVSLLCVEHISKAYGEIKRLVCRRRLQRLMRRGCKISGHQVASWLSMAYLPTGSSSGGSHSSQRVGLTTCLASSSSSSR